MGSANKDAPVAKDLLCVPMDINHRIWPVCASKGPRPAEPAQGERSQIRTKNQDSIPEKHKGRGGNIYNCLKSDIQKRIKKRPTI